MPPSRLLLDHSIVGQSATTLTVRKDRNLAACRICGAIFQPAYFISTPDVVFNDLANLQNTRNIYEAEREILEWRQKHNRTHSTAQHNQLVKSGLSMMPEAALKLAPFGLAPITDAVTSEEVERAMMEAPRAPTDDVDTSLKGSHAVLRSPL